MKANKLLKHGLMGIVISEFIFQLFFLILSILCGEMILFYPNSTRSSLDNYVTQFIFSALIGFLYGIAFSYMRYQDEKATSTKQHYKILSSTFVILLFCTGVITSIFYAVDFYDVMVMLTGPFIVILLFFISYFIVNPIFDKMDNELVDKMNEKISEIQKEKSSEN